MSVQLHVKSPFIFREIRTCDELLASAAAADTPTTTTTQLITTTT